MTELIGTHPDSGLYHAGHMPLADNERLRAVQQKQLAGEDLSIGEAMIAGRDTTVKELDGQPVRQDHVYRAIGQEAFKAYQEAGAVIGFGPEDEYEPGANRGVDWYLGGVSLKYGDVVLEAPASPDLFTPARDHGSGMARDPKVRHLKSSGHAKPVPMDAVRIIKQ